MSVLPLTPVTREDAARILSVSLSKLDEMIEDGILPPPRTLGGRRLYWHPHIFYSRLDQLLRSDTGATGGPDAGEELSSAESRGPKPTARSGPSSTELRSIRHARDRDTARLVDLNK
jgi:hypothetical protein